MPEILFKDLGLIDYNKAWEFQENIFNELIHLKRSNEELPICEKLPAYNYLLFCEHPHVYTLGKSGHQENMLLDGLQLRAKDASFVKTNRGGDITYHGPGQIVGYPIIDLEKFGLGIKNYIFKLEQVIINTLNHFGIEAARLDGATGVWLDSEIIGKQRKICAIGVKASLYVTMHGFAFNVNTDLNYFNYINPCGFTDKGVTSLEKELGMRQDFEKIKDLVFQEFQKEFVGI